MRWRLFFLLGCVPLATALVQCDSFSGSNVSALDASLDASGNHTDSDTPIDASGSDTSVDASVDATNDPDAGAQILQDPSFESVNCADWLVRVPGGGTATLTSSPVAYSGAQSCLVCVTGGASATVVQSVSVPSQTTGTYHASAYEELAPDAAPALSGTLLIQYSQDGVNVGTDIGSSYTPGATWQLVENDFQIPPSDGGINGVAFLFRASFDADGGCILLDNASLTGP